jgi:hypothetical protein
MSILVYNLKLPVKQSAVSDTMPYPGAPVHEEYEYNKEYNRS